MKFSSAINLYVLLSTATASIPFGKLGSDGMVIFLNGFHFLSGDTTAQISANHYCTILSDDFLQCSIYDTQTTPAHLAGIEYIISGALFETLDQEERQLWHSHGYEVTSGFLVEPKMPAGIDLTIMEVLVGTYGKTVHSWRYDAQNLTVPIGVPELVMGYTGDGQIEPTFVKERDELFGINSTAIKEARANAGISMPVIIEGADSWKKGFVLKYGIVNETVKTVFNVAG